MHRRFSRFSANYATYETSFVILARTLDFKSIFSYNDYTTTEYGDLNGDGTEEDIKTELTKQGDDCGGFTPIASFKGTFDGQNNKICNLYENRGEAYAGLFQGINGTIKNLGLKNITLIGGGRIGGIVASLGSNSNILNCFVEGTSTITDASESGQVGLIAGNSRLNNILVEACYSTGILKLEKDTGYFGGIIGFSECDLTVKNCYNNGKLITSSGDKSMTIGGGTNFSNGYSVSDIFDDEEKKTQEFVDELNILIVEDDEGTITETEQNVWVMDTEGINNGYPIFTWQTVGANSQEILKKNHFFGIMY